MKKVVCIVMMLMLVLGLYGISDAQKKPTKKATEKKTEQKVEVKEITIFGITLGKPFEDAKIPECKYNGYDSLGHKEYVFTIRPENTCYKEWYSLSVIVPSGWELYPVFDTEGRKNGKRDEKDMGRCYPGGNWKANLGKVDFPCLHKSVVTEIQMYFGATSYDDVLELVSGKFGKPGACSNSVLQNKMGATFDNTTCVWKVGNGVISLDKRYREADKGFMRATHIDLYNKNIEDMKESSNKAKQQF